MIFLRVIYFTFEFSIIPSGIEFTPITQNAIQNIKSCCNFRYYLNSILILPILSYNKYMLLLWAFHEKPKVLPIAEQDDAEWVVNACPS